MHPAAKIWAYGVSLAVIAAVLLPVLANPRTDSFPLSTYPMFSGRRATTADIPHVVAFTTGGQRVRLPPEAIANDEVIQAFETVRQAIRQGEDATLRLCFHVADWASEHIDSVAKLAVVTDTFDVLRYFDGDKAPSGTVVHSECEVRPGGR